MNKLYLIVIGLLLAFTASAQLSPETIAKRERRKNLVVKEWNKDAKGKNGWLDHVTTYDDQGRKVEEIEYANYGFTVLEDKLKEDKGFFFSHRSFLDIFLQLTSKEECCDDEEDKPEEL
jgi:hypothetical protein